jgi:hypothetical protein
MGTSFQIGKYETPNLGVSIKTSFQSGKYETPNLGVSIKTSFQFGKYETPELGVSTIFIFKIKSFHNIPVETSYFTIQHEICPTLHIIFLFGTGLLLL